MAAPGNNPDRLFESDYGYFSQRGYEYIITRPDTPRPWTNIISNGDFGLAISQAGGGFSWRTDANLNRLTRWNQDLILDDRGKWLYLRDLETGLLRSLAYQPVQAAYDEYRVRHGLGYSTFEQKFGSLETKWTLFAALKDPVELWICSLENKASTKRRLQLTSYLEWNLGAGPDNHREFHKLFITTEFLPALRAITATKNLWEVPTERGHWNTNWPFIGFHALNEDISGWDTSKDALIGRHGGYHNPKGIQQGNFTGSAGRFQDAAAALSTDLTLEPGQRKTLVFILGQVDKKTSSKGFIETLLKKYCSPAKALEELGNVQSFWQELTQRVHFETPEASFNLMVNIWLKYQTISAHLWGRTGYYQQSGAHGYRDQLQASQIWLPHNPTQMLYQIKLAARHQFRNGTVLHWWHSLTEQGQKTDMTDDLLWLPYMLIRYFNEVGSYADLNRVVPYYDQGQGTLQEHCLKAINTVLDRFSKRGLPLIGAGDWCDGFSAVGLDWKGESIWLGMFLYDILSTWSEILEKRSPRPQPELAENYRQRAKKLKDALNRHGWNGFWYLAATKDDGTPIGDPANDECKIYLNSQTWAIISAVADRERREKIANATIKHLEGDNGPLLFYPAFKNPDRFIGYLTRYAPGLRENGGVYTNAATWSIWALAKLGKVEDAMRIFRKMNPILQSGKEADRYAAEPYVMPGNIDGKDSEHYGRAGWTWYTGSSGWLFNIATEIICGVRAIPEGLQIDPRIPADWPQIKVTRQFRGATFFITIENPKKVSGGVQQIEIDGKKIEGNVIPPQKSGSYQIHVSLAKV